MAKEKKKVPNLRFKGFTNDWEQRKFKNNILRINRHGKGSNLPHIEFENINSGMGTLNGKISELKSDKVGILFEKNDILFGKLRPYLRNWFLATFDGVAIGDFWVLRPSVPSNFIYFLIQTDRFYAVSNLSSGSKMPRSDWSLVSNYKFNVPTQKQEMINIGKLLSKLDSLLSLQQRKLDLLKQLKKGLLQKMFADKDAKQPVLRFDGFSGDWEQRKGSELFKSKSDKGYSYLPVLSATQDQGMILREKTGIDIKYKKDSLDNYKRIEPGDFIIHLRSFQGGFAYSSIEGIASPAYTIFSFKEPDEYNDNFWKEKFSSHNFIQLLKKVTYGVRDGRSISYGDFLTLKEQFPNLQEQTKIGKLFTILDKTIPLQQSRLTKLTLLKRFLLQQMFI
ncbi:restriction endonuclease subunit S [Limosilactobacillus pontis]|nr:restriction endonuclease subunit S [Limosilactobacillus pontis]